MWLFVSEVPEDSGKRAGRGWKMDKEKESKAGKEEKTNIEEKIAETQTKTAGKRQK